MIPQELIRKKRDGLELTLPEIEFLVGGLTSGQLCEGQVAAFAMAVYFQGMTAKECAGLTWAMMNSGDTLNWKNQDLNGPVLDKHSTGGIGDKVSLMLAPLVAACGGYVPMISGRGLGHTGGTLDKLDSIPGYQTAPDLAKLRQVVREVGVAIIGQTSELAPADRRLYAIRDVTATVESIPLITASILSKKLAAGLDALVMDVKTGSGAFMPTHDQSMALAQSIVAVADENGVKTSALLTDMNQVLGLNVGNGLEVLETIKYLKNEKVDPRLDQVIVSLGGELLFLGGLVASAEDGRARIRNAREDGSGAECFAKMVAALGGPTDLVEQFDHHLEKAAVLFPVLPKQSGYLVKMDARQIGLALVHLGGGRTHADQQIDYAVGFENFGNLNDYVSQQQPIALVHARTKAEAEQAILNILKACVIADEPEKNIQSNCVYDRIALDQDVEED
ncbi:MAG: thymidine phosphorylase [Deltaproteobacteria bacterium]|nr:thymidine phosphorylase [Deltaproteobacteria bacterium]